jgi:hypothetical protein
MKPTSGNVPVILRVTYKRVVSADCTCFARYLQSRCALLSSGQDDPVGMLRREFMKIASIGYAVEWHARFSSPTSESAICRRACGLFGPTRRRLAAPHGQTVHILRCRIGPIQ